MGGPTSTRTRPALGRLSLLFALSGATALAYEVIWFKRLSQLFGSSALALGAALACFLGGLGLGAALFGRLADRSTRPLRLFALCEAGIGLLALSIPYQLAALSALGATLGDPARNSPALLFVIRLAASFVVLAPPCLLMGGTLPALARHFTAQGRPLAMAAARLYALNAAGAALGVFVTGFVLLGRLGLEGTNRLAAALDIAIALWVLLDPKFKTEWSTRTAATEVRPPTLEASVPRLWNVRTAAVLTGFSGLALEVVWTRQLTLILGGTTYAFSAMLAVFVAGIGLGSWIFRRLLAGRVDPLRTLALSALCLVVSALLGRLLIVPMTESVGALAPLRQSQLGNALICLVTSALFQGLPTIAMGLSFPALVALTGLPALRTGKAVGTVYAWNTAGSVSGALAASLFGFTLLGAWHAVELALVLYALSPLLAGLPRARGLPLVTSLASLALVFLPWQEPDPRLTNFGMCLYGAQRADEITETLYFAEGRSANVIVLDHPRARNLRVNGKVDASSLPEDMAMQAGMAYFPLFARPEAKDILVIGYGSGVTCGAALLFPGTRVTCCEIEPEVVAAAGSFDQLNHRPLQSADFVLVLDDGRSFVQSTRAHFDLILSEPPNPWVAGVSNLFSVEFYERAREKLEPDGLFAQWIQLYALSPTEVAGIVRSLRAVFPHGALLQLAPGDALMLAAETQILPDAAAVAAVQALVESRAQLRADLDAVYKDHDVRSLLLEHVILDDEGLELLIERSPRAPLYSDDNLLLEFTAPRYLFTPELALGAEALKSIDACPDIASFERHLERWNCSADQLPALKRLRDRFREAGREQLALGLVELGLGLLADDPELIADQLLFSAPSELSVLRPTALALARRAPRQAHRLGRELSQRGELEAARCVLEALTEIQPRSANAHTSLAIVYEQLDRQDAARTELEEAIRLDPLNELTKRIRDASSGEIEAER